MDRLKSIGTTIASGASSLGKTINTATTLSAETKLKNAERQANAMAWLSVTKNQRILLFSLVSLMVLISFAMLWSSDTTINKDDDLKTLKEKNADRVAKLQNLFIVSSITFVLLCGLGFFEIMAFRKE